MRGRTVLALLLVVGAMAAFIAFYERDLPSTDQRQARAKRLLDIESGQVTALTIVNAAGEAVLRRGAAEPREATDEVATPGDPGEWQLISPIAARADGPEVDRLVTALSELEKERTLEDVAAADVGLESPAASVSIELEDGSRRLDLGARIPGSSSVAAAVSGDSKVYTIADSIFTDLERDPGQWRSRDVFRGDRGGVERIAVEGGGEPFELERRDDGSWWILPLADRAEADSVDGLLDAIANLQVGSFVDGPASGAVEPAPKPPGGGLEETGLNDPVWAVELLGSGLGDPFRLEVGAAIGDSGSRRFARAGDQTFEADSELFAMLERSPAEWLSRRWTELRVFEIDRVSVTADDLTLALERSGSDWLRDGERVEATAISDLLYAVTGAEVERVLTGHPAAEVKAGLGAAELTFSLASDDGADEILTLFAAGDGGLYPAAASSRESLLLLPSEAILEIREALGSLLALPSAE